MVPAGIIAVHLKKKKKSFVFSSRHQRTNIQTAKQYFYCIAKKLSANVKMRKKEVFLKTVNYSIRKLACVNGTLY